MNTLSPSALTDRIFVNSWLVVGCFAAVLLLSSQSAASVVTYLLAASMLWRFSDWRDVFDCPLIWPIVALLVYLPLTSFWSDNFSWRGLLSQSVRALLTFLFVVAVAECQLRGKMQAWLGRALGLLGSLVAVLCIIVFLVEDPPGGRLNGLGQLDTQVVAALVFSFVVVFVMHALVLGSSVRWRVIGWFCLIPLLVAIVLSDSRNAWVAVVLGVLVLLAARYSASRQQFVRLLALGLGLALVAAATLAVMPEWRDALLPRGDSFRLFIWQETLNRVVQSPWIGFGILSVDDITHGAIVFQHPHSLYLSVLYQGGVLGLALFFWLLVRALRELFRAYPHVDARLGLGIFAVALPSFLLDGHELLDKVGDTWFLIWLPVALALGLRWHPSVWR